MNGLTPMYKMHGPHQTACNVLSPNSYLCSREKGHSEYHEAHYDDGLAAGIYGYPERWTGSVYSDGGGKGSRGYSMSGCTFTPGAPFIVREIDPYTDGYPEDSQQEPPQMHQFDSGAKSSTVKPRYDLVPARGVKLAANRFAYGAARHGARNYLKGAEDEVFITDRINHLIEHVLKFSESRQTKDLEALLCNGMMLAELKADRGESSLGGTSAD